MSSNSVNIEPKKNVVFVHSAYHCKECGYPSVQVVDKELKHGGAYPWYCSNPFCNNHSVIVSEALPEWVSKDSLKDGGI